MKSLFSLPESVLTLCETPKDQRASIIKQLLTSAGVSFSEQPFTDPGTGCDGENIVVRFHDGPANKLVLSAHHDIDPGTVHGANDNMASCAHLIEVAKRLKERGGDYPVEMVFTDLEEPGNGGYASGAYHYASNCLPYDLAVVLDVTGIGRVPNIHATTLRQRAMFRQAVYSTFREIPMPPADDVGIRRAGRECVLMCMIKDQGVTDHWGLLHTDEDNLESLEPFTFKLVADWLTSACEWVKVNDFPA
jgi:Iap family predicted aminopeptidase